MDSRITPGNGHNYEEDPNNRNFIHSTVIEGGDHDQQQHEPHEKKSVLNKVKAKAKKIKDTLGIKKHGHGQEREHEQEHDHHHEDADEDLEEEDDDDDEELEVDPEVHGAPKHESSAPTKFVEDMDVNSGQPRDNLSKLSPIYEKTGAENFMEDKNVISREPSVGKGEMPPPLEKDPNEPKDRFGTRTDSPGNYQTKVTDSTDAGGKEIDVEPVRRSFGKMEVTSNDPDLSNQKSGIGTTGSHDQFSPHDSSIPTQTEPIPEDPNSIPKSVNPITKHQETNVVGENQPTKQSTNNSSYTDKLSSATYAIADKAISAKNVVASKLGYGNNDVADKNSGSEDPNSLPKSVNPITKHQETSVVDENQPTKQSTNNSSYTDKLSSATYAIADKAISAKNVVASKLGYGNNDVADKNTGSGTGEYGKQVDATGTKKLSPVYEKVSGAGSAVVSMVSGTGQGSDTGTGQGEVKGPDKGVSIKEYLAEKFRPSEEDRALSEVISDAVHKRNEDSEQYPKKVQDAMGRVTESEEVAKRLGTDDNTGSGVDGSGRVTVGDGTGSGYGMVGKLKGSVASWLKGSVASEGDQTRPTPQSHGHSPSSNVDATHEEEEKAKVEASDENEAGERRLQESTN